MEDRLLPGSRGHSPGELAPPHRAGGSKALNQVLLRYGKRFGEIFRDRPQRGAATVAGGSMLEQLLAAPGRRETGDELRPFGGRGAPRSGLHPAALPEPVKA